MLVNSNSDLIRLINNGIKNDLSSRNPTFMNLALHCIANVGSREMAETFASEVPGVLVAGCVPNTQALIQLALMVDTWQRRRRDVTGLCFAWTSGTPWTASSKAPPCAC